MPRVIFVNRFFSPDISATSQMLSDLAFRLAEKEMEVVVVTGRTLYNDRHAELPSYDELEGVEVFRVWASRFGRQRFLFRAIDYLTFYLTSFMCVLLLAKRGDWIVAKTDPPLLLIPMLLIARLRGARLANWFQDVFPEIAREIKPPRFMAPIFRQLLDGLTVVRDFALKHSDTTAVIGSRMREYLISRGIPAEKLTIIPNWADTNLINPIPPESNPLRDEWGLQGKTVVGYSGNLGFAHNFDVIRDAADALRDNDQIVFLIIGGGLKQPALEAEVKALGLENIILFKAYQPREKLAESLSAADIHLVTLLPQLEGYIVPSKFYGVSAAGRPTIYLGDADGEIGRSVSANRCGESLPNATGESLAEIIKALDADTQESQKMGERARALVERTHSSQRSTDAWLRILTQEGISTAEPIDADADFGIAKEG